MTTAIAVAAVLAFSFALGSLIRQVDGATLRRWRLSRRWDVSRLAREFTKAADEPLATLRGLTHMINAWERGVRRPSERYWLLYLRVFPECTNGETVIGDTAVSNVTEIPEFNAAPDTDADLGDIHALAATVKDLEQQIAGISKRLDELSGAGDGEKQSHDRSHPRKTRPNYRPSNWTPLWSVLVPVFN
jgi:hypothetical protein